MSLADEYKQQYSWREWPTVFDALPLLEEQNIFESASFEVTQILTLEDEELAFSGPARAEVLNASRARFKRMKGLIPRSDL
jgi:hypothetical protein